MKRKKKKWWKITIKIIVGGGAIGDKVIPIIWQFAARNRREAILQAKRETEYWINKRHLLKKEQCHSYRLEIMEVKECGSLL